MFPHLVVLHLDSHCVPQGARASPHVIGAFPGQELLVEDPSVLVLPAGCGDCEAGHKTSNGDDSLLCGAGMLQEK